MEWANQPLPFKIYTSLQPIALPTEFVRSAVPALYAIAGQYGQDLHPPVDVSAVSRLCYFSNGVTRVLRGMPFRAAACTGALYHIELYLVCADLPDLAAGVYHYGAHDNALRQLRHGDFRAVLVSASGAEPTIAQAPAILALTSTWWRNSWKYQARAYRHAFWDSGTILANLLAVARGQSIEARTVVAFADAEVNALLDIDPAHEGTICLVALGANAPPTGNPPAVTRLDLPTRPLSHHEVDYPQIVDAHRASSLPSGEAAAAWRTRFSSSVAAAPAATEFPPSESIESVILRRGSSRRFTHDPITAEQLNLLLAAATSPLSSDAESIRPQPYLIVNAVEGLEPGTYLFDRAAHRLELLQRGEFRREAAYLDLGQELAGDAAVDVYWLIDLDSLDDRGYRAAQLVAAIEGGRLYLAAYSQGLGATGLTFFDDEVTRFFSPHAAGKSVMFLTAVGHAYRRR